MMMMSSREVVVLKAGKKKKMEVDFYTKTMFLKICEILLQMPS